MKGQARAWVEKGPIMADRTSGKTGGCGTEGALRFEFTLARRIVSNTAASPGHQIIGLCAEPGIGGSKFIEELKAGFAREKLPVRFRNFGAQEPERATRTLVRFSNGTVAEASAPRAVVFLEGLPPSDEAHVQRQVRAIRKVAEGCAAVVVAVLPEAEQLLEELEEAVTLTTADLAMDLRTTLEARPGGRALAHVTRGAQPLVECLAACGWKEGLGPLPPAYYKRCGVAVGKMLRDTLSPDEQMIRAFMVLVGKGSLAGAASFLGLYAEDYAYDLMRLAPLLGVSADLSTYDALGSDDPQVLSACLGAVRDVGRAGEVAASKAMRLLTQRGDFLRASLVAEAAEPAVVHDLVLGYSSGFLNAGKWQLVRDALADVDAVAGLDPDHVRLVRHALLALTRPSSRPSQRPSAPSGKAQRLDDATLCLFLEARGAQARITHFDGAAEDVGPVGRGLVLHLRALSLVGKGRFSDAIALMGSSPDADVGGVASLLLAQDRAFCLLALGEVESAASAMEGSEALASSLGCRGMSSSLGALRCAVRLVAGTSMRGEEVASAALACEKCENALGRMLALGVGVLRDLKVGNDAQASLRGRLLARVASQAGRGYARDLSRVVCALAAARAGSRFDFGPDPWSCEDVGVLAEVVTAALSGEGVPIVSPSPPSSVMWVIVPLVRDLGDVSSLLREQVPSEWRARAAELEERWETAELPCSAPVAAPGVSARPSLVDDPGRHRVEVCLLGTFSMRVGGRLVADGRLDRRDARTVLEFLLLKDKMSAQRYEVIAQVWPEDNMEKGASRLYQATTAIRGAVKEIDPTLDVFSVSKAQKSLALDPSLVSCDVDEFEAQAKLALERRDPATTIRAARRAEELYGGDLCRPTVDASGLISARRVELRSLYVDALVAGADAALQTGRDGLAVSFGREAVCADDMREDAFMAYMRALKASGRGAEASAEYEKYARRVVRVRKLPPSRELRDLANRSMGFSARERYERRKLLVEDAREVEVLPLVPLGAEDEERLLMEG